MGGCLAPDKNVWYLVDYEWIQGKSKCTNLGQDKILEANNKTREIVSLQYLQANEAIFMVGMCLELDSNNNYQVK